MSDVKESSRRWRTLSLSYSRVLSLAMHQPAGELLELIEFDLPADARVVSVHNDWMSGDFRFLIESEEFEVVPKGIEPLEMPARFRIVRLKLLREAVDA